MKRLGLPSSSIKSKQRGVVMVMTVIALTALIAVVAMVLDSGYFLLSKTRLQNAVDAAALSGARTLEQNNDPVAAQIDALATFISNANSPENNKILDAYNSGGLTVNVEFSATLDPFTNATSPETYVRVTATNFVLNTFLAQVVGIDTLTLMASAVSGPSPSLTNNICDIAPVMMCGEADDPLDDEEIFGYPIYDAIVVKQGSNQDSEVGPGNFQLIRIGDGNGGAVVRDGTAGGYDPNSCLSEGDSVETEPGNTVGPVVQGFNTRFGDYQGPVSSDDYPPDFITTAPTGELALRLNDAGEITFSDSAETPYVDEASAPEDYYGFSDYDAAYNSDSSNPFSSQSDAVNYHRRMITVPVGDCTGTTSGQGTVGIFGFACMYLIQPVVQQGNEAHVFAQIVEGCNTSGTFSMTPVTGPLPTKIILYKDPDNVDA